MEEHDPQAGSPERPVGPLYPRGEADDDPHVWFFSEVQGGAAAHRMSQQAQWYARVAAADLVQGFASVGNWARLRSVPAADRVEQPNHREVAATGCRDGPRKGQHAQRGGVSPACRTLAPVLATVQHQHRRLGMRRLGRPGELPGALRHRMSSSSTASSAKSRVTLSASHTAYAALEWVM